MATRGVQQGVDRPALTDKVDEESVVRPEPVLQRGALGEDVDEASILIRQPGPRPPQARKARSSTRTCVRRGGAVQRIFAEACGLSPNRPHRPHRPRGRRLASQARCRMSPRRRSPAHLVGVGEIDERHIGRRGEEDGQGAGQTQNPTQSEEAFLKRVRIRG